MGVRQAMVLIGDAKQARVWQQETKLATGEGKSGPVETGLTGGYGPGYDAPLLDYARFTFTNKLTEFLVSVRYLLLGIMSRARNGRSLSSGMSPTTRTYI